MPSLVARQVSPTTPRRRLALVPATLLTLLLVAGCSGDDPSATERDRSDAAATAATTGAGDAATDAAALVETGLAQLNQGDTEAATATFRGALALDDTNVFAHYNLGLLAQRAGEDAAAVEQYDAALGTDPDYAPALFNRGILSEASDLEASVAYYRRAVESDDTFAAAYMRLGFALEHLGQIEEAETMLGRGVALDPAMAEVEAPSYPA